MFTRGRLVPRQPRAIKRTTRTELRCCDIRNGGYIHLDIGITPTALHDESIYFAKFIYWDNSAIPTQLRDETIVRVTLLIIKGEIV